MPILNVPQNARYSPSIRQHAVPSKHVLFDDLVEVHIEVGIPSISFKHFAVHGLVQSTILKYCANFELHDDEDSHVNMPRSFAGKDTIRKLAVSQQNSHTTFGCPSTWPNTILVEQATNPNAYSQCASIDQQSDPVAKVFKHLWTCHAKKNPVLPDSLRPNSRQFPCTESYSDDASPASPVHMCPIVHCDEGKCLRNSRGVMVCRLEHQSPIEDRNAQSDSSDDEDDTPDDHNDQPWRPYQPAFVHRLEALVRDQGMHPDDGNFDLPVRTWYINHVTTHRWTSPRLLQIVGPPHTWEAQVAALWTDQIDDRDWFDVFVVEPDPPRIARHQFVRFDLIVTQALDSTRQAGLITVIPAQSHMFDMYAVAGSFQETVSGNDIVQMADAAQFCLFRVCTITHRWHQIPNTLIPTHMVGPGDGYQILVHEPHAVRGQAASSTSLSDQDSHTSPSMPSKQRRIEEPSRPANSSMSRGSTSNHDSVRTLHIFQLEGCEVVVPLIAHQPLLPTHELAAMLQIPLDCLETFHVMPLRPDGLPEQAVAAIVQRSGDVQPRTTDQLIMIDILYYHHATARSVQPTLVREVRRVGYQIIRPHLLMTAAVFHYCQNLVATCEVYLDGVIWPEVERTARPVVHGSYALIEVHPPEGFQVDTQVAATTLQDDGEHDTFMHELQEMHQTGEHLQLTQVSVKVHRRIPTRLCPTDASSAIFDAAQMGAVLRPKVDLNPQSEGIPHIEIATCAAPTTNNSQAHEAECATSSSPAKVRAPVEELCGSNHATRKPHASDALSLDPISSDQHRSEWEQEKPKAAGKTGQTTLYQYFSRSGHGNKEDKAVKRPTGQTTLTSYFKRHTVERCPSSVFP